VEKWHHPNACVLQGSIGNLALAHHQRTPRPWHSGFSSQTADVQTVFAIQWPAIKIKCDKCVRPETRFNHPTVFCARARHTRLLSSVMTVTDETHINPRRSSDHRRHSLQCPRALLSCNRLVSSLTCLPSFAWYFHRSPSNHHRRSCPTITCALRDRLGKSGVTRAHQHVLQTVRY
jgi:hypothetical protein